VHISCLCLAVCSASYVPVYMAVIDCVVLAAAIGTGGGGGGIDSVANPAGRCAAACAVDAVTTLPSNSQRWRTKPLHALFIFILITLV
jgi:hypothetical protein